MSEPVTTFWKCEAAAAKSIEYVQSCFEDLCGFGFYRTIKQSVPMCDQSVKKENIWGITGLS